MAQKKELQRSFIPIKQKDGKEALALMGIPEHFGDVDDEGFLVAPVSEIPSLTELVEASRGPDSIGRIFGNFSKRQAYGRSIDENTLREIRKSSFLLDEFFQGERNKTRCKEEPIQPYPGSVWLYTRETKRAGLGKIVNVGNINWQIGFTDVAKGAEVEEGKLKIGLPIGLNYYNEPAEKFIIETARFCLDDEWLERAIDHRTNYWLRAHPAASLRFSEEAIGQQLIMRRGEVGLDRWVVARYATRENPQSNRPTGLGYWLTLVKVSPGYHSIDSDVGIPFENLKRVMGNDKLSFVPKLKAD